jgi:hypothetical protein
VQFDVAIGGSSMQRAGTMSVSFNTMEHEDLAPLSYASRGRPPCSTPQATKSVAFTMSCKRLSRRWVL